MSKLETLRALIDSSLGDEFALHFKVRLSKEAPVGSMTIDIAEVTEPALR